jgi:hypothetical protein
MADDNHSHVTDIVSAMIAGGLEKMSREELHCLKQAIDTGAPAWHKLHECLSSFAAGLVHLAASIEPAKTAAEQPPQVIDTDDHGLRRYLGEVN